MPPVSLIPQPTNSCSCARISCAARLSTAARRNGSVAAQFCCATTARSTAAVTSAASAGWKLVITSPFAGLRTSIALPVNYPNNGCAGSSSDMAKPSQSTDR
jgi:hypothetical protein